MYAEVEKLESVVISEGKLFQRSLMGRTWECGCPLSRGLQGRVIPVMDYCQQDVSYVGQLSVA